MSLSICLLTRDAEDRIAGALQSVAHLAAEVLVGDTGSTDRTVETARAHGAHVSVLAWHDDFGAAQNQLLDQAAGDWILWLNPDEVLLDYPRERLAVLLDRADVLAYGVRVQVMTRADRPEESFETAHPRLVRRHPELRFVGRLHPHFVTPLEELARRENLQIAPADFILRHHAYLSVLTEDKLRWAVRLLELELRDRPGQLHYLIEYGRSLLRLNEPRGHEVLAEAADLVLELAGGAAAPTPTVASLLEYLLTVSPQQSQSRVSPAQARELVLRWFAASPPLLFGLAQRDFQARDYRNAAGLLERVIELGRTGAYDRWAPFDPTIMAEPSLLNLGHCYAQLGELERADACFAQVSRNPAYQAKAQHGHAVVQALRRPHGA